MGGSSCFLIEVGTEDLSSRIIFGQRPEVTEGSLSGGSLGKNVPGTRRECEGWRGRVAGVEEASDPLWRASGFSFGEDGEPLEALSKV